MDIWKLCQEQADRRGMFHDPLVYQLLLILNKRISYLEQLNIDLENEVKDLTDSLNKSANSLQNTFPK